MPLCERVVHKKKVCLKLLLLLKVVPQACESYADLHTVLWSCFLPVWLMAVNQSIGMQFEMTQWTRQQKDVGKLC